MGAAATRVPLSEIRLYVASEFWDGYSEARRQVMAIKRNTASVFLFADGETITGWIADLVESLGDEGADEICAWAERHCIEAGAVFDEATGTWELQEGTWAI